MERLKHGKEPLLKGNAVCPKKEEKKERKKEGNNYQE